MERRGGVVPLGWQLELGLGPENATSYPAPGELLLYPGGVSEVEILFPYGATCFASMGQLAGNHFATIGDGRERLAALGDAVVFQGGPGDLLQRRGLRDQGFFAACRRLGEPGPTLILSPR